MCTVVHGDCGHHHAESSGFGVAEFVAVLAGLAGAGAGYVLLEAFWPVALVLWLATATLAAKRVRTGLRRGLGWLLRETAKVNPARTVPYLMRIRTRAPRLVLRAACETLPPAMKKRILA